MRAYSESGSPQGRVFRNVKSLKSSPNQNRRQPRGNNQNRKASNTRASNTRPSSRRSTQKKKPNHKNQQRQPISTKSNKRPVVYKSQSHQRVRIKPNQRVNRPKIKYIQDAPRKRVPFAVYFLAFFGFILGILTLTAGANVTLQRITNSNLESELTALLNLNSNLELQLSGDLDMIEIEYRARTHLNMSEPLPHLIIYIELPPEVVPAVDFTILPEYEYGFFGGVSGFLSRFWSFIMGDT